MCSDDIDIARPSKAPGIGVRSKTVEDARQRLRELDEMRRLRAKEFEAIERRNRRALRKKETSERQLEEIQTRLEERCAQQVREAEEAITKQEEELNGYRQLSERSREKWKRDAEAAREQRMMYETELQNLESAADTA